MHTASGPAELAAVKAAEFSYQKDTIIDFYFAANKKDNTKVACDS